MEHDVSLTRNNFGTDCSIGKIKYEKLNIPKSVKTVPNKQKGKINHSYSGNSNGKGNKRVINKCRCNQNASGN